MQTRIPARPHNRACRRAGCQDSVALVEELFGSLLMTGFGLITSGLILIGMVWGIRKLSQAVGKINLEGDSYE